MVKHGGEIWERHPHVRTGDQLSFGERAADVLKNVMGTWSALGLIVGIIIFWLLLIRDPGELHLNLALSFVASIQGVVLQIAANRIDRANAEAQTHHVEQTDKIQQLLDENTALTKTVASHTVLLEEIHRHVSGQPGTIPARKTARGAV